MRKLAAAPWLLALIVLLAGCELAGPDDDPPDYSEIDDISFSQHVQPLLQEHFGGLETEPGLRLDSWQHLFEGSEHGAVIIPFDAAHSVLVQLATTLPDDSLHALGGTPLSQEKVDFLRRWINEGAPNDAGDIPYEDARNLVYVCNQSAGLISVIDPQAKLVIRTVKLYDPAYGFVSEGASGAEIANLKPHHVAVDPDGSHFYVSLIGADAVAKLSREAVLAGEEALEGTAAFEAPGMLARHPSQELLFSGHTLSLPNVPSTVAVLRTSDMRLAGGDPVSVPYERPHPMTVHPDGRFVYSASLTQNRLAALDLDNEYEVELTAFDQTPNYIQFAVAPDGNAMYLTARTAGEVLRFALDDPAQPTFTEAIDVPAGPWHPVFSDDGQRLYFGNKGAHAITVLDAANRSVETVIQGEGVAQPHGSALPADGRYLYISNNNQNGTYTPRYAFDRGDANMPPVGTVVIIDTATNEIVKVLELETYPTGMNTR